MKKSIKKTIISLALCASASCVVGGLAFMQPEHEVADAAVVAASYNTVDGFTIEDTASVRNTNPNGIRFHTVLDAATKATFDGWDVDYDVSYGTLMIPADYLGSQALTHETDSVLDVPVSKWQDEAKTTWTSVLAGTSDGQGGYNDLSESYYNRPIVARSYVKVTDGEGNTTYYYTTNTAIRSIGYVAMMEYLDPDGRVTELIEKVVEQTKVELAFNEAGMISAVQNNNAGTAFVENALPQSSDELAVLKIGGMALSDAAKAELESWGYTYDISYTSGNQDVVGVDGTTLTAKAEGESAITASLTVTSDEEKAIREFPQASITSDTVEQIVSTTLYTGVSEYKIYINENSANAAIERQAAELMQKILADATGIDLPIVTSVSGSDKYISIGETTEAVAVEGWSVTAETASQLIVDETTGNAYFRGVEGKAILYGVQEFLSRHVGYEYLMENTYSVDEDVEVIFADESFVRDITYNKLQGNAVDGYGAVPYTDGVISLGTHNTDYVQVAAYHQGVAHNSVLVVDDILRTKSFQAEGTLRNKYTEASGSNVNWYATYSPYSGRQNYRTIANPYYKANNSTNIDPFATYELTTDEKGNVTRTWVSSPQYIPAELCYTAHGDSTSYANMKAVVVNEMLARLEVDTELDRLGFSHMDHRVWCSCDTCAAAGNPSDNLLKFLLEVAADVKTALTNKGDSRAETFKISSLFYHATNTTPKSVSSYESALRSYGKHIEVWFAETAADYTEAITAPQNTDSANKVQNGESNVNYKVYENLQGFKSISNTYCGGAMDILWWGYYGMVTQFFVPYNSLDALRANYGVAYDEGVDHMFNQMMGSQVNFTRLKEYIMGKLTWNAKPDDDTWNGWINDYFEGAYGAGADKMKSYYAAWKSWAEGEVFNSTVAYDPMNTSGNDASIWHHVVMTDGSFTLATLENWANLIDQAIVALDPNDPNYDTYYWNIKLEKATPLYLIMYIYGENAGGTSDGKLIANNQFGDYSYVRPYGEEFLEIVNYWKINSYGEGLAIRDTQNATTHASTFVGGIETALANVTSTTVAAQQTVVAGNSFTLNDSALTAGTYTAKIVNANDANDKPTVNSVTVTNGTATINATLSAGATYIVELNSTTANVKFNDVLAISGYITNANGLNALSGNGYYIIANDIDCNGATISNTSFSGTLDGNNKTVSNLTVGANGIFGTLNGATVKNVNFANLTITGSVLANSTSDTNIENVTVSINGETTMTAATVFGTTSASSFANVAVNAENTNGLWPTGVYSKYTKAEKKQYSIAGSKDATLALTGAFVKGDTYTVSVDGISSSVIAYSANKISVTVGDMAVGTQKTVIVQNNTTKDTYAFDVVCVTDVIKTSAQLAALGVGTLDISNAVGNDITGYYLLVNDIDCAGRLFTPGHSYGNSNFIGTFDGNGYTISNLIVGDSGIFGGLKDATIKDVNFTGVEIELSATAGWNYGALFANAAMGNTTIENVSAQFTRITDIEDHDTSIFHTGLMVANGTSGRLVYRNVTLNVANATTRVENTIPCIFGSNVNAGSLFCDNVTIFMKVSQQNAGIIYSYSDGSKQSPSSAKPAGVTIVTAFGITNTETVIAAGDSLEITTNNEVGTVEVSLLNAVEGVSIIKDGDKYYVKVEDSVLPNTPFTVVADNGSYADQRTFKVAKWQETLDECVIIEKTVGTFTVPDEIDGTVEYVKINGITVYDKAMGIGSISDNVITCDNNEIASIANASNQELVIANDMYEYTLMVDVCDQIEYIETLEQLKDIGVGGLVNANNGDNTGYFMLANDITIEHAADYSDVVMAGYPHDYAAGVSVNNRFKGTFNGNGYTIHNIRVADGGIFGVMSGATIKNVNFTNVEYLRNGLPASGTSYNNGSYISLFGYSAQNTTIEDIHFTVAAVPSTYSWQRMGMLITSGSAGATTFRNITIDASGLTIDNILGISHNENSVYENVTIIADGYFARGYTGDSYTSSGANTAAMLGDFPAGVTFYHPFTITNTKTEVEVGKSFDVTVSSNYDSLTYTYDLAETVEGITISNATVNVAGSVALGTQFTVVVTSNEGFVQEKTFTVGKAYTTLAGTVTIEAITDKLDLSAINGIAGNILSIKIESSDANVADLTVFSGDSATAGEFTMASRPVKMAHLGENKALLIETANTVYTVNANVYTMVIDNADELDQWQSVAADNSVAAGLVIELQKNAVLSGYFALGNDIEYNKVWTPIAKFAGGKGTLYQLLTAGVDVPADTEGAIWEDWGAGKNAGFKGVFDGNGHAIKGMETSGQYNAFIITMGGGTIKDVAFTGAKIGTQTSLIANRGSGTYENIYVQVVSMESGVSGTETQVFMTNPNTNAGGYSVMNNIIVDVSAVSFADLTYAKISNLAYTKTDGFYVLGVEVNDTILLDNNDSTEIVRVFRNCNTNTSSGDYDKAAAFVKANNLLDDATHGANVRSWATPWNVTDANVMTFGNYEVYDGLVETVAQNTVDVVVNQTAAYRAINKGENTTVDLSEIYSLIEGKTVTVKYNDAVVYEGTIDSATWTMPLTEFAITDKGLKTLSIVYDGGKISLPINLVQPELDLNMSIISDSKDLVTLLNLNPNGHFVLTEDLAMSARGLMLVSEFNGILDGQGHVISGTWLHHDSNTNGYNPQFIATNHGTIRNLGIVLDYMTYTTGGGNRGLVTNNNGTIENVYVRVKLNDTHEGKEENDYLNTGIVAQNNYGTVRNVMVDVTVADGVVLQDNRIAAVTFNNNATIENAHAVVTGATNVLTVKNNASATCYNYTLWSEVSADNVTAMGEPWSVVDNAVYFGTTEIGDLTVFAEIETAYENDENHQITFEDAAFTQGSTWTMTVAGMAESEFTVETAGQLTVTIDAMAINAKKATINLASGATAISFTNVNVITYIKTAADLKLIGRGRNSTTATDSANGYYVLANDITFEHADDYSDVITAGYSRASGTFGVAGSYEFRGVFDGNGHKLINMRVSDGGIFGTANGATIRNLILVDAQLLDSVPSTVSNESGGYAAIFAYAAPNSTIEDIEISLAKAPAGVWTYKRDGLFVVSGSSGVTTFRNIMVDASYMELKTLLGISHNDDNVYEDVVIKAASYLAIGYTADSYNSGVQNTAALMADFPDGVTFETVAHAVIPNQPLDTSYAKLTQYTGDETAFGFADGTPIFEVVSSSTWDNRILFPADSDNYDYVEFDIYTTVATVFTAWPSNGSNTQGSMTIYGSQMNTSDGLARNVQVWDANGNTFAAQYTGGFAANTFYTVRICFVEGETVKYVHFGPNAAQTYYVTAARWGTCDVENDVYTNATGALLPKYEGDVTALGFDAGSTVTQVTIADAWNERVGINTSIKYDYVDVEWSFTGDRVVYSLCVWAYGTGASILTGNYTVTPTGGVPANNASARTIQVFDTNGNTVNAYAANTVYIMRVYLNGDASTLAVSTFDTSAESSAILNFGDITFGNEVEVNETVEISVEDGTFTLPDAIEGTVKAIMVDGAVVYSSTTGSLNGKDVAIDVELTAGAGKVMTVITDGDTYVMSATVKVPDVTGVAPLDNANKAELTAYSGDTTSMGFKAGDNVYEIVNTSLWTDRILIPADSANYDYVEFDVYPTVKVSAFTAWPSNNLSSTQGSFGIYGAQMNPTDSAIRSVHVWDANGNTFRAQYTSGFEANTFYTIRLCFAEGETVQAFHFGTGTAQTYYISSARWGNFDVQNDVYTSATGALLPKYEGDVTALGFDAGSVVTQVSLAGDAWNNRVGVYGNVKYDYVDVEFSFTGDRTVYSLCVWAYGTNASILTGNYTVNAAGCTPANGASERKAYILDAQGADVVSLAANTVYTLRVFLNGDTSAIAVSTFDTSADSSAILNFGDITYGNEYNSDEYIILLPATGSYTLPDDINGTVKYIYVDGTLIYSDTVGSLDGNIGMYDADFAIGTEYDVVVYTYENDTYYLKAIGADAIIKTAQELQALGVGGRTVDGVKQGQGNSDVAGNDVTGYYVIANDIDASGVYFAAGYFRYKSYFSATLDGLGHTVNNVIVSEGGIFGGMYRATVKNVTFAGVRYHGSSCGKGYNNNQNYGQYFGLLAHWADKITVSNVKVVIDQMEHKDWNNVALFSNRFQTANVSTFTNVEVDATGIALNTALGFQHTGENIVYDNVSIKAASVNVIAYSDDGSTALTEWPTGITFTQDTTMVQYETVRDGSIIAKYAGDETKLGFEDGTTVFVAKQDARSNMWNAGSVLGYTMEQQKTMIYKNAEDDYASILFAFDKDIASYSTYMFFCWYYIDGANKGGGGYLSSSGAASGCPEGVNVAAYNLDGTQATSFKANTVYELRWYGAGVTAFGVGYAGQNANPEMINVYWANPSSGNDAA